MNFIIISFAQMIKFYCNEHVSSHQKLVSLLLFNGPSFLSTKLHILSQLIQSFPGSSAGKESACNAWDPSSISGSGRFPREGISYPLQYSWTYLVAQMVKNLPAMQETWVRSLSWEDPLEEGVATHSSIHAWRIPVDRGGWRPMGLQKSQTRLRD